MKKLTAALLAAAAFLMPVHAEPTPSPETEPDEEAAGEAEEETEEYAVDIASEYAVLIELESGTVLFDKNAEEPGDPASLAKMMTVLIAAEELRDDDPLTMSAAAFQTYNHDQGVLWIQQGETLTVKDCEYATMLASANDTCAMLAEGSAGDITAFVKQMNQKAEEIGMTKTHFENPFGTAAAGQYSTAYDLALLMREAMKNKTFASVFSAPSYTIGPTNMQAQKRTIANDCELLLSGDYSYEGAAGGKIGSTPANGFALAACAKRGTTTMAAVVMHEENADTAYRDITRLFDYGFDNTHMVTITPEDIGTQTISVNDGKTHVADVVFSADSSYNILLPMDIDAESISSEIVVQNENSADPSHISARVVFLLNGEEIGSSPLKAEIILEPEKEPVNIPSLLQKGFDWLSVIALAAIIVVPLGRFIYRTLLPPK